MGKGSGGNGREMDDLLRPSRRQKGGAMADDPVKKQPTPSSLSKFLSWTLISWGIIAAILFVLWALFGGSVGIYTLTALPGLNDDVGSNTDTINHLQEEIDVLNERLNATNDRTACLDSSNGTATITCNVDALNSAVVHESLCVGPTPFCLPTKRSTSALSGQGDISSYGNIQVVGESNSIAGETTLTLVILRDEIIAPDGTGTFRLVEYVLQLNSSVVNITNLVDGNSFKGEWTNTQTYVPYDVVQFNFSLWISNSTNTNSQPGPGGDWRLAGGTTTVTINQFNARGNWSSSSSYIGGDYVTYDNRTWIAVGNSTNVPPGTDYSVWGPIGFAGPSGATGPAGTPGRDSFTYTNASFVMPAALGTVAVNVLSTAWMGVGQPVFIEGAGTFQVVSVDSGVVVTLQNLGYTNNTAPASIIPTTSLVTPAGFETNGLNGENSFTHTTADFIVPAVLTTVVVSVENTDWMGVGQPLFIETAGSFLVTAIGSSVSVTVRNLGYTNNTAPGVNILSGALVTPSGFSEPGTPGANAYSELDSCCFYTNVYPGSTVAVMVLNSDPFNPNTVVNIEGVGNFLVLSVTVSHQLILRYLGTTFISSFGSPAFVVEAAFPGVSICLANFIMPLANTNVTIQASHTTWATIGQNVYIGENIGYFTVLEIVNSTTFVLNNLDSPGNLLPGLNADCNQSLITPSGYAGPAGTDGNSFTNGGVWNNYTNYVPLTIVGYNGTAYVNVGNSSFNNTGVQPDTDPSVWTPIGTSGADGMDAFSVTQAPFTMPGVGDWVVVSLDQSEWIQNGQYVYIATAGIFTAGVNPSLTSANLTNTGCVDNAAPTTIIVTAQGVSPGGRCSTDGENAYTTTTASFVVPITGGLVNISVLSSQWMGEGQVLVINSTYFVVQSKPSSTLVLVANPGYGFGVSPGGTIGSGSSVVVGGLQGIGSNTTSGSSIVTTTSTAIASGNGTFSVNVTTTSGLFPLASGLSESMNAQIVSLSNSVASAGYFYVISIISATEVTLRSANYKTNLYGVTIASGYTLTISQQSPLPGGGMCATICSTGAPGGANSIASTAAAQYIDFMLVNSSNDYAYSAENNNHPFMDCDGRGGSGYCTKLGTVSGSMTSGLCPTQGWATSTSAAKFASIVYYPGTWTFSYNLFIPFCRSSSTSAPAPILFAWLQDVTDGKQYGIAMQAMVHTADTNEDSINVGLSFTNTFTRSGELKFLLQYVGTTGSPLTNSCAGFSFPCSGSGSSRCAYIDTGRICSQRVE